MIKVEENSKKINIEYARPLTSRRISAALIDFLIMALLAVIFYIISNSIAQVTPTYVNSNQIVDSVRRDSGLYVHSDGIYGESSSYEYVNQYFSDNPDEYAGSIMYHYLNNVIDGDLYPIHGHVGFAQYMGRYNIEYKEEILNLFDEYRLNATLNNAPVFDSNFNIINGNSQKEVALNVLCPFIEEKLISYLSYIPNYYESLTFITRNIIYIQIPIPIILSNLIVFYLIPLCFRRDKKSIGRLLFKIGLVDKNYLYVNFKVFTLRFLIFLFVEIILSIFTFLLPLILSFTMMLVTKNKQCLHDYILNIQEIDETLDKVYYSLDEAYLDRMNKKPQHIDFKLK